MAMTIMHDSATMSALTQVNINIAKQNKAMKQLALGERLTSAGDGAAEYSISEKMKVRMRALNQDRNNVQNGASMLQIAERAIQSQIDILRGVKAKVIEANNDTNTDEDRATIQKEIDQAWDQMEDIAYTTNFNGKYLLHGGTSVERIASWVVKDIPEFIDGSSMGFNLIHGADKKNIDGQEGDFAVFSTYSSTSSAISSLTLDGRGTLTASNAVTTNGSDTGTARVMSVDLDGLAGAGKTGADLDNTGFSITSYYTASGGYSTSATYNFILTTDTSRKYNSTSYTAIAISDTDTMPDIADKIAAAINGHSQLKTHETANVVGGTKIELTSKDRNTDPNSSSIKNYTLAAKDAVTSVNTKANGDSSKASLSGGADTVAGDGIDKPGDPGAYAALTLSGIDGDGFEVTGYASHKHYIKFDNSKTSTYKYENGVIFVNTGYSGKLTDSTDGIDADVDMIFNGTGTIKFQSAYKGSRYNSYTVKRGFDYNSPATPAYTKVTALGGEYQKNVPAGTSGPGAAWDFDLSAYNNREADKLEVFIKGMVGKTISIPDTYSSSTYSFVDTSDKLSIDAVNKTNSTYTIDLGKLRQKVSGGQTIADAFVDTMKSISNLTSRIEKVTNTYTDGGGDLVTETVGMKIKSLKKGTAGNADKIGVASGKMNEYSIDFAKYLQDAQAEIDATPGGLQSYLHEKGFRAYCASCPTQWFNFVFKDPTIPMDENKPASGIGEYDIMNIEIDTTGMTDYESLLEGLTKQASKYLKDRNHYMNAAYDIDTESGVGKFILYDSRREVLKKENYNNLQPDSKNAKIADGILDNVVKDYRDVLVERLVIQHTDKANQNITVNLPNTTFEQVFGFKKGNYQISDFNVYTREMRDALLGKAKTDTTPEEKGWLDTGLDYLTGAVTLAGAQITRMHEAEANIVTEHENTTNAESVIRDTDMAMAMTEFTKYNVLAQAAQSMLAQANQNSSNVLSLLQ